MFKNIIQFFNKLKKSEKEESKSTAKERLHLVLAQDRANISADFLEMMKQEILEVIKKYIDIDEKAIDVRLTNKEGEDGSVGAPALYANIPIITIKNEARKLEGKVKIQEENKEEENTVQSESDKEEENLISKNSNEELKENENYGNTNLENEDQNLEKQADSQENENLEEVDNEKKNS